MAQSENFVTVTALCGKVRGTWQTSSQEELYYSFKGLPYAKPPTGPLRFRDPEPIEPWTEVRDATSCGPDCAQYDSQSKTVRGSDDCLYLNVYTKCLDEVQLRPVMVYIHGGAFVMGSGSDVMFGPDYLLTEDIVLVTINYRLGVFGFLNLEDAEAPGNLGFKDQIMALKWVQTNISRFGGNPGNVTIFGESAGSASVHFLTLSPLAQGLFHKAICQSGCALNPWSQVKDAKQKTYEFLNLLNFSERNSKAILEYLRTVDCEVLVETQEKLMPFQKWAQIDFPFGPGVDDSSTNPFMPIPVSEAAKQGIQVPLIIGYNNKEGLFLLKHLSEVSMSDLNSQLDQYLSPRTPEILQNYKLTLEEFKRVYCGDEDISRENIEKFLQLWGDLGIVEGTHKTLAIQNDVSGAPTYFYKFSYDKNITPFKDPDLPFKGASHADELTYLFSAPQIYEQLQLNQLQDGTGADAVMKKMVHLWTQFAKYGRPTPITTDVVPLYWQPINSNINFRCLNIGEELRAETIVNIGEYYSLKKEID